MKKFAFQIISLPIVWRTVWEARENSSRQVRRLLQDPMERCQWLGLERRDKWMERYLVGKLIG